MVDESLFADLVELYNTNVKLFEHQNSGLLIDKVYPLTIEDVEAIFPTKELIDTRYIKNNYIGFTINPVVTELEIKNNISRVEISPDISWERKISKS